MFDGFIINALPAVAVNIQGPAVITRVGRYRLKGRQIERQKMRSLLRNSLLLFGGYVFYLTAGAYIFLLLEQPFEVRNIRTLR